MALQVTSKILNVANYTVFFVAHFDYVGQRWALHMVFLLVAFCERDFPLTEIKY